LTPTRKCGCQQFHKEARMGGGTKIVQPTPPPAPTVGESAREFAAALPDILKAQLEFQPEFDQATFDSFAALAPEFARVTQEVLEQFSPEQAALPELLAKQAAQGAEEGLPDELKEQFKDTFKSLVGNQVNSGVGANAIAKNLLGEDLAFRQFNQNLGLALQNKVPITTAFQNPSSFQVASTLPGIFGTASNTFGSVFSGAGRPIQQQQGGGASSILGGIGGALTGFGGLGTGLGKNGFGLF
jgi:hypothetical protein